MIEDVINAFEFNLPEELFDVIQDCNKIHITFTYKGEDDHVLLYAKIGYFLATLNMLYIVAINDLSITYYSGGFLDVIIEITLEERKK